jgi:transposase
MLPNPQDWKKSARPAIGLTPDSRIKTTPEALRLRRCIVEYPFAALQYRIFGNPRFLLRGLRGAQTGIGLATMAYNLKHMTNVLGGHKLAVAPAC